MAFTDFLPIPEINRLFQTNDGRICIVVDLLAKGDNSYVIAKDIVSEKQFEWNAVEWNNNIDSILSDTHPFVQEYAKSIKSAKELIQDELDEIQTKRNAGKELKGKCGKFKEFLWTFAGADKDLLRMCPTDHARIAGFGGTILTGGILSGLALSYGAHMLTNSILISVIVGVVCFFLTIFFDSFITNTMYSDGEVKISKREFISSLPRILLGIIQGIVIAVPIQIKVFEPSINDYITNEYRYSILNSTDYISNEKEIIEVEQEIKNLHKIIEAQRRGYATEMRGSEGCGIGYKAYMMNSQLKNNEGLIVDRTNKLDILVSKRDSLQVMSNNPNETAFSFSTKLEALSKIVSFQNNESVILPITNLLICFMFILLCVLPIINKMIMTDGVYDKMLKLEEDLTEKLTRIHIEELEKKFK